MIDWMSGTDHWMQHMNSNTLFFHFMQENKEYKLKYLPFLASSSHCLVSKRYRGDSGHTGNNINCKMAGQMAKPAK